MEYAPQATTLLLPTALHLFPIQIDWKVTRTFNYSSYKYVHDPYFHSSSSEPK